MRGRDDRVLDWSRSHGVGEECGLFLNKMLQSEGSRGIKDEPGFWPE